MLAPFVDEADFIELEDITLSYAFCEARPRSDGSMMKPQVEILGAIDTEEHSSIGKLILKFERLLPKDVPVLA